MYLVLFQALKCKVVPHRFTEDIRLGPNSKARDISGLFLWFGNSFETGCRQFSQPVIFFYLYRQA